VCAAISRPPVMRAVGLPLTEITLSLSAVKPCANLYTQPLQCRIFVRSTLDFCRRAEQRGQSPYVPGPDLSMCSIHVD
jgi:hypothetical protein